MTDQPLSPADRVTGIPVRARSYSMFTDLPGMSSTRILDFVPADDGRQVTVIFDRHLTPDEALAVWERLTSADDTDLADRTQLRALAAEVAAADQTPLTSLVLLLARRALSEPSE